jgi:hypothetical protein
MVHLSYVKSDAANFFMGASDTDKGDIKFVASPCDAGILITRALRKRYQDL